MYTELFKLFGYESEEIERERPRIDRAFQIMEIGPADVKRAEERINEYIWVESLGYGRHAIDYADRAVSEIICHAKGVHFLLPETEAIVDIGCQDSKIIRLDNDGNVTDFSMNDKCAAGTGRFLEVMANALGLSINEIGPESSRSVNPCHISSTCTVFAESEVITLRARGASRPDLVAGIHQAIAKRVLLMATNLGGAMVVFTGGVAKNSGVQKALEAELGRPLTIPEEPQLTGALGAACIAIQECLSC